MSRSTVEYITLYHYTDWNGYNGIRSSHVIKSQITASSHENLLAGNELMALKEDKEIRIIDIYFLY